MGAKRIFSPLLYQLSYLGGETRSVAQPVRARQAQQLKKTITDIARRAARGELTLAEGRRAAVRALAA